MYVATEISQVQLKNVDLIATYYLASAIPCKKCVIAVQSCKNIDENASLRMQ